MPSAIHMINICKTFPGVIANNNIEFSIEKGEIHGLLGENGAGKSVLMSILYGLYKPDSGKIFIDGSEVSISKPSDAMNYGIGMVHQHFMLVPSLTVLENIVLGSEQVRSGDILDMDRMFDDVSEFCKKYRLDVELKTPIYQLPVGLQQRVEILKTLYRGADILILDEPTAVLNPIETESLFKTLRELKDDGKTVIFISHKLKEVLEICDQITVLKRGEVMGTVSVEVTNESNLAQMMVGRKIVYTFTKEAQCSEEKILSVKGIECLNDRGLKALRGLDLEICGNEILGLAGVEGNGQTELVEALMGLRKITTGSIFFIDEDISNTNTYERILKGICHIPEDRYKRGIIPGFSVLENLILGSQRGKFTNNGFSISSSAAENFSKKLIKDYQIATPTSDTLVQNLSGGNQQRIVVAREFSRTPKIVLAAQPTRGLDVGASEYVRKKLVEIRDNGAAVLLTSADLDEILSLSDRIAVIYEGKIISIKNVEDTSLEEIGLLMAGGGN